MILDTVFYAEDYDTRNEFSNNQRSENKIVNELFGDAVLK